MKYEETVEYIRDLAIGYDGFNTVESLKGLIDEIREVAEKIITASKTIGSVEADAKEPCFGCHAEANDIGAYFCRNCGRDLRTA